MEMLTTSTLAEHVMVGHARIFGRFHDWQIVGERIYSRAEVRAFLDAVARCPSAFTAYIESNISNAMNTTSPYAIHPDRVYRIENEGSSDNDWFRNDNSRTRTDASGPAERVYIPQNTPIVPLTKEQLIQQGTNHVNASGEHLLESAKSTAKAYGRVLQGDPQGAIEEGAKAVENLCKSFAESWKAHSYFETANDFWSHQ